MSSPQTLFNSLYRIEQELGSGGGGVVYKAWHMHLQKYVVIKELKRGTKDNIETQRNEVEALKNVKSAYLPQVLDFIVENDRVFTVMEYIDGISFDKLLVENHCFSQKDVVKWYSQLAIALEIIHNQNIVHRDIKPANIMLLPNNDVCLIDFNAALVGGNDVRLISRSLGYASPEQYEIYEQYRNKANAPIRYNTASMVNSLSAEVSQYGGKTELISDDEATELVDESYAGALQEYGGMTELVSDGTAMNIDWTRSDIYSLGATMYHMLTGMRPRERAAETPKLSAIGVFDEGLTYIVESSMSLNPASRIPSATALAASLRSIYKLDSHWKALQIKQIIAAVMLPLAFAGFMITSVIGYNKLLQEKEERLYALVNEIQTGKSPEESYSTAIELFDDRIEPYYAQIKRYCSDGDLDAAKAYITEKLGVLAKFKTDETAAEMLGYIYYAYGDCFYYDNPNNDYQNAKINYELALEYDSTNPTYHRDYAITLARLGDIDGARAEMKKAQLLKLDAVSTNLLNGEIDYASGQLAPALDYFAEVLAVSDDSYIRYRAYHSSDEIYRLQGELTSSIELLSDSLDKIPINRVTEMKERLADSYYSNGQTQSSIALFEELAETNPSFDMYRNLVILYQNENDFTNAERHIITMRGLYPKDYRVPMQHAFLEVDRQSTLDNKARDYSLTVRYYNEAKELYADYVKPGEDDPEMQQLESIIRQLKDNNWIR